MNENDKFHSADFEVNSQAISDEELDAVSGGTDEDHIYCVSCGAVFKHEDNYRFHLEYCTKTRPIYPRS